MITAIVLTYNEEKHIIRCILSLKEIVSRIIIVDSFSTDNTCKLAVSLGAEIVQRKFFNQAEQFQWALDNCNIETEWILRLDADEYLLPELNEEIKVKINEITNNKNINGLIIKRRLYFFGKWIKHGGYYPVKLLRIWRNGFAYIEQKQMDEHTILKSGESIELKNDFVDENINDLTTWIQKHNNYSNREVEQRSKIGENFNKKNKYFYLKFPLFWRSFMYFIYRYIFKLGFLDGKQGLIWHFLQGFWYQFLVDAKIYENNFKNKLNK